MLLPGPGETYSIQIVIMSDTPRTDEQELAYEAEDGSTYVHTTFARQLEREIRQLEVAVYDLKTENNLLHEALDQVIEDRDSYHNDISTTE